MARKLLTVTTLTWKEGPTRHWEAQGKTLRYDVLDGWRISTLTVRDNGQVVHMRFADGADGARELQAAAVALEVDVALSGLARALRNAEALPCFSSN